MLQFIQRHKILIGAIAALIFVDLIVLFWPKGWNIQDEGTTRFVSSLELTSDGMLHTTEEIDLRIGSELAQNGISRTFPRIFEPYPGEQQRLLYTVLRLEVNGNEMPIALSKEEWGEKLIIQKENASPQGKHRHTLSYRVYGTVRKGAENELIRSITGLWRYPLPNVTVQVRLPQSNSPQKCSLHLRSYQADGSFRETTGEIAHRKEIDPETVRFELADDMPAQSDLIVRCKLS